MQAAGIDLLELHPHFASGTRFGGKEKETPPQRTGGDTPVFQMLVGQIPGNSAPGVAGGARLGSTDHRPAG